MRKVMWILMTLGVAACGGVETDEPQAANAQADTAHTAAPAESCQLARDLGYSETDVRSCMEKTPVKTNDASASPASNPEGTVSAQACTTYYGSCTGFSGCSRATGEGWSYTYCGSWSYAWLTVCNGQASSWGTGACAW